MSEINKKRPPAELDIVDKKKANYRRRRVVLGAAAVPVAAAAIAAGVFLPGHNNERADGRTREVVTSAEQIAQRFDCQLISTEDLGPSEAQGIGLPDAEKRTEVRLSLGLKPDHNADKALARYEDDDTIQWLVAPNVTASVISPESGERIPVASLGAWDVGHREFRKHADGTAQLDESIYPKTTYPDGTIIDVMVSQQVMTHDQNGSYTSIGSKPCGVIVFENNSFKFSAQPSHLVPEVVETFTPSH